ncbi:MAG: hypothetical protein OXC40_02805 [Proteobacteria bacterium]|nr:hypothetical protein [Pseudomonadota bacterium]
MKHRFFLLFIISSLFTVSVSCRLITEHMFVAEPKGRESTYFDTTRKRRNLDTCSTRSAGGGLTEAEQHLNCQLYGGGLDSCDKKYQCHISFDSASECVKQARKLNDIKSMLGASTFSDEIINKFCGDDDDFF